MTNPLFDQLFGCHLGRDKAFLTTETSQLSYDDFLSLIARYAGTITECGLRAGDRLAVQIAKSPEALAVYGACVQAGVVFLPLNTGYTAPEMSYFVSDSGSKLLLCDEAAQDTLRPVAAAAGARLETLNFDGSGSFAVLAAGQGDRFETINRSEDDLAALLYTSGTTGRSKGVMLSQGNLLSNAKTLQKAWHYTGDDVLLHALPIFHTHGLFVATNLSLLAGASMIFLPKFDLDMIIARLTEATVMMGVPTFYTRLLDDARLTRDATAGVRLFISGSAPLLAETHAKFQDRTGHMILERYGMTETNMTTSNPYDGERRAGTVGFPLPQVDLRITDTGGAQLPAGEVGQIEVRGPNVFQGYWKQPEKTKEEMREDGFFLTGDLGRIDADGYVHIVGRNKDLIISGGYNVYPKEIEQLLDDQPGVLESAVIGVPHPDFGESVVAVIVKEPGENVDIAQIRVAIGENLAGFKRPRHLEVVGELPRNAMGKVQKNLLRKSYRDVFAATVKI